MEGSGACVAAIGEDAACLVNHSCWWRLVWGPEGDQAVNASSVKVAEKHAREPATSRVGEQGDGCAAGGTFGVVHCCGDSRQVPVYSGPWLQTARPVGGVGEAGCVAKPVDASNLRGGHVQADVALLQRGGEGGIVVGGVAETGQDDDGPLHALCSTGDDGCTSQWLVLRCSWAGWQERSGQCRCWHREWWCLRCAAAVGRPRRVTGTAMTLQCLGQGNFV